VQLGGRRTLLCLLIRPGQARASDLLRIAADGLSVDGTLCGMQGWTLSWGGRAVRECAEPVLDSYVAMAAICSGRLLGGVQTGTGAGAAPGTATAAGERAAARQTAPPSRSRLAAYTSSVLQGLVGRLRCDRLQVDGVSGPRLPAGGSADGAVLEKGRLRQAGVAQGGGRGPADEASADAEGKSGVTFDEAADDDELLRLVFTGIDTDKDGVISREELDEALEAWTGGKELAEGLQGAVDRYGREAGMKYEDFKTIADKVRPVHPEWVVFFRGDGTQ
jgi:hypothetical protein